MTDTENKLVADLYKENVIDVLCYCAEVLDQQAKILETQGKSGEALVAKTNVIAAYKQAFRLKRGELVDLTQQEIIHDVLKLYQGVFRTVESSKHYHDLAIFLSERGMLNEAVTCFQAAPQIKKRIEEVYHYIWQGLNELGRLDDSYLDNYPQDEFDVTNVSEYFGSTSQYRVMNIDSLTEIEKQFLTEDIGLSMENLELIGKSGRELEEIYINSFSTEQYIRLAEPIHQEGKTITSPGLNNRMFQQSIIETGYIYSICPFTGKIVRSNQSFSIGCTPGYYKEQIHIYRFIGKEVFYVGVTPYFWQKTFVYFPKWEMAIGFENGASNNNYGHYINTFKSNAVSSYRDFISYVSNNSEKKAVVVVMGFLANVAHYLAIELGGFEYLYITGILSKVDKFLLGNWDYFEVGELYPEVKDKIIPTTSYICEEHQVFKYLLQNKYFALTATDFYVTEAFAGRINEISMKKCSTDFLREVETANHYFPLLFIQVRSHQRIWISQVEGIANIIKSLFLKFPNLGVVFDGWSSVEWMKNDPYEISMIEKDQDTISQIISLIPSSIKTYSVVGKTMFEKLVFANAVDVCLAPAGTGTTFTTWLANKPTVAHMNKAFHNSGVMHQMYVRENVVPPVQILTESAGTAWNSDYEVDWESAYKNIVNIIESLGRKSDNEVCQEIWQGLNNLCDFDENNTEYRRKLHQEFAERYFSEYSQYKVVDMSCLTEADKDYLSNVGVHLGYVELCELNSLSTEEMFINDFQSGFNLQNKVEDNGLYDSRIRSYFQQSIVETGYIYTACPISGNSLRSNQSFSLECPVWWSIQFYRFEGTELFYLISDDSDGHKSGLYFPKYDLLIILRTRYQKQVSIAILNKFKSYAVSHWQKFKAYISNSQKRKVAALVSFLQLPHFQVWVDLTGVHCLYLNGILDKVDQFLCSPYEFFDVHEVFPEINSSKVVHLVDNEGIFEFVLENNLFVFRPADCFAREELANRICQASLRKCSQSFLEEEVEQVKSCFPLLFIQFRRARTWSNQIEGTANFIQALHCDFPRLGVVFDGQTRLERCSDSEAENLAIQADMQTMQEVLKLINPEIKTYSMIGRTSYEKVVMAMSADLHTGALGNGVVFPSWIANKPSVGHTNTGFLYNGMLMDIQTSKCRENMVEQRFVPIEHITDIPNPYIGARNYHLDWQVVYKMIKEEVIKIQKKKDGG